MSLSPENYRTSIGIAGSGNHSGSCLVYLDRLIGETPSGCDGWTLKEKDGMIFTDFSPSFAPNRVFPSGDEEASRHMFSEVQRIRKEYLAKQGSGS